ncbi:MAG TPA: APC family permease [Candidatus Sulfotelmatobacter sp.]|jgi:amino acid transporter|nr:APC family permease [Candidatus Sulfotelmatobacter sp.]
METSTAAPSAGPRLRRTLTLWDLVLYGIIVIQPVAPMSVFGVLSDAGHGHVVTTLLIAMVAMLFTAFSYGRMARAYPSAGSAFTYVGQEINPALGYVTGWSMTMDYMLNPMICIIWCSQQAFVFAPHLPYWLWAIFFGGIFTFLNIQGIKTSARVNTVLAAGMGAVVAIFFMVAARYIFGHPHDGASFFSRPFYDPQLFNSKAVLAATSIAVLSYIGFDGISTLSEEAENPRRNILLATVLTCFVIGILSALEVYAAQLVWPANQPFPNSDTAFTYVAGRAWKPMFAILGFTLLVANFGSGMGAQIGAARLLYGMGRSKALPQSFFGVVDPKRHVPRNNVIFVGVIALAGALLVSFGLFSYGLGAEMLNFGALIAFMGVNMAAFVRYHVREGGHNAIAPLVLTAVVIGLVLLPGSNWILLGCAALGLAIIAVWTPPLAGFTICFFLWKNLSWKAWIVGGIWMVVGIAVGAWKTRGFRGDLVNFELPPEEQEI